MATKEHNFKINPPPPNYLNKELLGVWSAWSRMGDREVIREAAAKGIHVDLACTFLATRRQLDSSTTQDLFRNEVLKWMLELLSRRQVFRASHIISNINLNPIDEFTRALLDTFDDNLRNYLGDHLDKLEKLEIPVKKSWNLLKLLKENCVLVQNWNEDFEKLNVKTLYCDKSYDWKCDIGTDLFFKIFDETLKSFVTSESAWKILVKQNNADLIKLWINVRYSYKVCPNVSQLNPNTFELLRDLFSQLEINEYLIDLVTDENYNCSVAFQNIVLDELSKYGIFNKTEKNNFIKILNRLVLNGNVLHLRKIFTQNTSNVSFLEFSEMLIDFCISNKHFSVLNWCQIDFKPHQNLLQKYNSKHFNFMCYLNNIGKIFDEKSVIQNVIGVSQFLSSDVQNYLVSNPLILIAIILLSGFDLLEILKKKQPEIELENLVITWTLITESINNLPFLKAIVNPSTHKQLTYKDLLISQNLQFDFHLHDDTIPNFNSRFLIEKFGYKKTLNYTFYLKQSRPSFAAKLYAIDHSDQTQEFQSKVNKKVLKLIAQNYNNKDITSSCVAFLEMIGQNSECTRIYIKGAEILSLSGNFSFKDIEFLIANVGKNPEDFLVALEKTLIKSCTLVENDFNGINLVEEIKKHELTVKFSRVHYLKLPQLFLEYCARNNYWLVFLVFVQTFHYPLNDVQKLMLNFRDCNLVEHLFHGVSHDIQIDDQRSLMMRDRDSRKYYLSRIGVRQTVESPFSSIHSNRSSIGSYGSTGSSSGSTDFLEMENLDFTTDFLQILIKCHNSVDPPKALLQASYVYKNPLFAVLAISYEPDSIITNWLTWLIISCEIDSDYFTFENMSIASVDVTELLATILKSGYVKTLLEGFQIFLPDNPLIHFVDFLLNCIELNFDDTILVQKLLLFETQLKQKGKNSPIIDTDYELIFLFNQLWLETTASKLLAVALQSNFGSRYNQLRFLKFLVKNDIASFFTIDFPQFQNYVEILSHLLECTCSIKVDLSEIFSKDIMEKELTNCIDKLLAEKHYNCSFKIAQILQMPTDLIIVSQWKDKFENHLDGDFWINCEETFKSKNVQPAIAVNFFDNCSFKTTDQTERYKILKLAYVWAFNHNLPNVCEVEKKMWLAFFQTQAVLEDNYFMENTPKRLLYSEIKPNLQILESPINDEQILHLNITIEKLLNDNNFWQALRLASIFNHKNLDLEILILCCNLAEGLLRPDQLSVEQRILMVGTGNMRTLSCRKRRTLMSTKGFSSFASAVIIMDQDVMQDILLSLETLTERVKNGSEIAKNILMAYRISINTQRTYQEVFKCKDSKDLLKEVLNDDCVNKLEVVHDVSLLFSWSQEQIANFLCQELINTMEDHIKLNLEPPMLWNLNLDNDFHLILQLLIENCSILGLKLYTFASTLYKMETRNKLTFNKMSNINLIIELLIRAHDCFTTDCNMEGISTILRKSQTIISSLLEYNSWKLIVRLLTGVGRYSEMNYVFHILKENDQFEFLLCKGNSRDNHLKLALLNYLKKYCPENRELYRMVALHFTLFSEIAELWEEEAKSIVRNLIAISKLEMQNNGLAVENELYVLLTNTDGTKLCLNRAMINYTHATEYHLQGKKLIKAMNSAKQAELLALQISLLKGLSSNATAICILNIEEKQITSLITTELSFAQSLILVEAYKYKVDWSSVLFEQFVMRNQVNYLDNFLTSFALTDTLVVDISRKFLNLKAISDTITKNMKEIVKGCSDVCTKYRIASELGFYDLVEDLLGGSQLAYLKDTAWKTGFSR